MIRLGFLERKYTYLPVINIYWQVHELANRGVTLTSLLRFWQALVQDKVGVCSFGLCIVHGSIIEEIACANLLFEGLGNLPPGGFQIEEGQVEQTIPGTTLGTTLVDQTPSHFK